METKQIQSRGLKSLKVKCNEFFIQFIIIYKQSLKLNKSMLTFRITIFRFYHHIMGDYLLCSETPTKFAEFPRGEWTKKMMSQMVQAQQTQRKSYLYVL